MNRPLDIMDADVPPGPLRSLVRHWLDLVRQADGRVPSLRAVDPLQFAPALQDAWIVDAGADGRFRFRLCGETLAEWYGFSLRGRCYEEVFDARSLAEVTAQTRDVLDGPMALYQRMLAVMPDRSDPVGFGRVALPLAGEDGDIRHMLGATRFDEMVYNGRGSIAHHPEMEHRYLVPALAGAVSIPAA